jgi:hypothetical protein|tara:strand:+ start:173 stop:367 length:195 start_codon:yes stop_codon:yes gene_type:complete
MFCTVGIAEDVSYESLNENLKKGYKITKETSSQKMKTFTLKNKNNEVILCLVDFRDQETMCWKP